MAATTSTYADSMARINALCTYEAANPRINPECASIVMEHGRRTRRSIVCMHGITSSPVQFRDLGALFFERGYNVLILRMPRHGYRDRLTHAQSRLKVADYQAYVTEATEIGRGLGEHLTVAGLSVSGVLAAWVAQTRADLDLAVPIAPSFAPRDVPPLLIPGLIEVLRRLPNLLVPWDFRRPVPVAPGCSYPRFSTHAVAEAFRLGAEVLQAATRTPPAARSILVVTNPGDMAVNDPATRTVVRQWRIHADRTKIREYVFGPELQNMHDIIGPYQPNARVDYVYPILLDLIDSSA
ncbi:MAG TPA: alpha/beta fold hydrolase [Chloroflexota bacterium]|nr:alpha/beta fold hydrolase [Chloroflexota bacterium]